MPFNPNLPANGATILSAELRSQFNGLKDLIDAVSGVASAVVDGVTALNPGDAPTVSLSVVGGVLHMSFGIPRGSDGATGVPGPQGPPFAAAIVDGVNTLDPGNNATVTTFFDGNNVHFTFGIPRGATGDPGIQGPPGEVSAAALALAVTNALSTAAANSSASSNGVAQMGIVVSDPPTQGELQAVVNKLDELIAALRRP